MKWSQRASGWFLGPSGLQQTQNCLPLFGPSFFTVLRMHGWLCPLHSGASGGPWSRVFHLDAISVATTLPMCSCDSWSLFSHLDAITSPVSSCDNLPSFFHLDATSLLPASLVSSCDRWSSVFRCSDLDSLVLSGLERLPKNVRRLLCLLLNLPAAGLSDNLSFLARTGLSSSFAALWWVSPKELHTASFVTEVLQENCLSLNSWVTEERLSADKSVTIVDSDEGNSNVSCDKYSLTPLSYALTDWWDLSSEPQSAWNSCTIYINIR